MGAKTELGLGPTPGTDRQPDAATILKSAYAKLLAELGPQGWWPGRTRLEVILGAILTQNTTWRNAALALRQLRRAGWLILSSLRNVPRADLELAIRPAGFFRQKAQAIQGFVRWIEARHGSSLWSMFAQPPGLLRADLLKLRGIGPETADAILLYAGRMPFFVADNYTRRILARHELIPADADYASTQAFLHGHLPADPILFNEFHALLVEVGKRCCKRQTPSCEACPLREFLPDISNRPSRPSRPNAAERAPTEMKAQSDSLQARSGWFSEESLVRS